MNTRLANFLDWMELVHPLGEQPYRDERPLTILIGPAASGKTALMKRWMHAIKEKEPDSPGIIFIEARKAESPYRFFHRLLQQLGEEETKRQPLYEFMQTLRAAMQQSSVDLLVIDSAEHLNREMLDCLRGYLYDDWRISLLLVGQPKLLATCKRDESFQSRIGAVHSIEQFDHQPAL